MTDFLMPYIGPYFSYFLSFELISPIILFFAVARSEFLLYSYFVQYDNDNIALADTLHAIHKVSFLVLENRFRLDWAVTFPSTVEGKGSDTGFFNIYGLFDATQGRSRCSSYTS